MADVPRADPTRVGPIQEDAETRLAELERRTDELVRAWIVMMVDDLSLEEVRRLRLDTAVDGFLAIFQFVIDEATRAAHGRPSPPKAAERYADMGRIARDGVGDASVRDQAVHAVSRLQGLLKRELRGSNVPAWAQYGDPAIEAVAAVCDRLMAAAGDDTAASGSEWDPRSGPRGSAA